MTNEKDRGDKWRGNLYDWLAPKLSTEERDTLDNLLLCTENAAKAEAVQAERERCAERAINFVDRCSGTSAFSRTNLRAAILSPDQGTAEKEDDRG